MMQRKSKDYFITETAYYIEIAPRNIDDSDRFKERIYLRKSSKKLYCDEKDCVIEKGSNYIRDKFWWKDDYYKVKTTVNNVCLDCWRGQIPVKIATNFTKK